MGSGYRLLRAQKNRQQTVNQKLHVIYTSKKLGLSPFGDSPKIFIETYYNIQSYYTFDTPNQHTTAVYTDLIMRYIILYRNDISNQ